MAAHCLYLALVDSEQTQCVLLCSPVRPGHDSHPVEHLRLQACNCLTLLVCHNEAIPGRRRN